MNRVERFVDTWYWLAVLNTRDQYHQRAIDVAARLTGLLVTTDAVLFEVGNALARPRWRALAATFLQSVDNDPNLTIIRTTPERYNRAVTLYAARPDKAWGLTDCLSFVVMEERGIHEALSADHDFEQAGFRALLLA